MWIFFLLILRIFFFFKKLVVDIFDTALQGVWNWAKHGTMHNGTWHFVHCIFDVLLMLLLLHALHLRYLGSSYWHVRPHIIQPQFIRYSVNGLLSTCCPFWFFSHKIGWLCYSPFSWAEVFNQVTCKHGAEMQGVHRVVRLWTLSFLGIYCIRICNGRISQKVKYSHPPSFITSWDGVCTSLLVKSINTSHSFGILQDSYGTRNVRLRTILLRSSTGCFLTGMVSSTQYIHQFSVFPYKKTYVLVDSPFVFSFI